MQKPEIKIIYLSNTDIVTSSVCNLVSQIETDIVEEPRGNENI